MHPDKPAELLLREPPFFASKFRWIDSWTSCQRLGHPQPGRMQRPPLIVIEDPAHRRAIVEHHRAGGIDHGRRRVRRRGRRAGGFRGLGREVLLGLGLLPLEHGLFDRPQAAHLLPHPDLGMAVGLQDGLGQIAEEVVVAVAVRHVGEFRRDPRDERLLLIRHPEPHRRAQGFGPLLGLRDQASDLVLGGREQRLGEPDALPGQLPHDVEGLVSLLGLEAVDAEDDLRRGFVVSAERLGVLLPRREHDLVTSDVLVDRIFGELDRVVVQEFGLDQGDRHVAGTASMSDPAEDVPTDRHLGQSEGDFEFGALGLGVSRTGRIGTVVELADQLHRTVQGMEAAIAVIADVHHPSTGRTVAVKDVEFPEGEIRVRRPSVSHPADLRDHEPSIDSRDQFSCYVRKFTGF